MSKVVVVIPAFNEAAVIRGVVEPVRAMGYHVLVVDDGSSDNTASEARAGGAEVLRSDRNVGVGAALTWAMRFVERRLEADVVVLMDADGQHDPADIPALVTAVERGADLANGSRFLGRVDDIPWHRYVLLCGVLVGVSLLIRQPLTDPCCGLKAFRPAAFQIRSHRFAWAAELCYRVSRWGRVVEIPVTVRYTDYSRHKGQRGRDAWKVGLELVRSLKEE